MKKTIVTFATCILMSAVPVAAGDYVDAASRSCAYLEGDLPQHTACVSDFLKQVCEELKNSGDLQGARLCYQDAQSFLVIRRQELLAAEQFHLREVDKIEEERRQLREDTQRRIDALKATVK